MCGKGHILSVLNTLGSKKTKKLTTDTTKILDTELKSSHPSIILSAYGSSRWQHLTKV